MRTLIGFILPVALAATATAATVDPPEPALGQRALLRLDEAPADSTVWPVALNAALRPTDDPSVFELVPLRVGEIAVALPATGDTLRFTVPTTIADASADSLRPLHSVGEIRPRWGRTILLALAALALVGGTLAWWLRRRARREIIRPVAPPEPAHLVALRELDHLERAGLLAAGRFEEFYVRGSHVLREYAGRRFEVPVLDWTTSETLDALRADPDASEHMALVAPLLSAADEVKFARHRPQAEDGLTWLRHAREFVQLTTVRPPRPGEEPGDGGSSATLAEVSA